MGMDVKLCKQCKRLFQSYGADICAECVEQNDKDYSLVKEYIYNNSEANVAKISIDTGVEEKKILQFLREGRLSINSKEDMLACMECGTPISNGRYCDRCTAKLETTLRSVVKTEAVKDRKSETATKKSGNKMHSDFYKKNF